MATTYGEIPARSSGDTTHHLQRPLLTYEGAEDYSGISARHLRRLRAERRIGIVKIGRRVYLDPAELDAIIDGAREPAIREVR